MHRSSPRASSLALTARAGLLALALGLGSGACSTQQAGFDSQKVGGGSKGGKNGLGDDKITGISDTGQERGPGSLSDTGAAKGAMKLIEVPCPDDGIAAAPIEITHRGALKSQFQVKANWCVKAKQVGKLRLMFLVDHSGSMELYDPDSGGDCGRLRAARALIDKVSAAMGPNDDVQVAAVTFADDANTASDFVPLRDFGGRLNATTFCQAVGATNYGAGFNLGADLLRRNAGGDIPVVTYLFSDGLPSVGADQEDFYATEANALAAATAFRAAGKVTINAVYLQGEAIEGATDPSQYLARITGSSDQVRIVNDASSLAASIAAFDLPLPELIPATSAARIEAAKGARPLELAKLLQDPGNKSLVSALTKPFSLEAPLGENSRHVVKIIIDLGDGTKREATVIINFDRRN